MIRMAILWTAALLLAMAGAVACGGDDESTGALSRNEYLILTLRLEAEQDRTAAVRYEKLAELWGDRDTYPEARREQQENPDGTYTEWADALAQVTPPPEAQTYHETVVDLLPEIEKYSDALAGTEDPEERSRLNLRLLGLWLEFNEALVEVQALLLTALDERSDDPLSDYLSAASEARLEFARKAAGLASLQQELLYSNAIDEDPAALLASNEAYLAALEDFEERWQELTAPPDAEELHQRQAELTADLIGLLRSLQRTPGEEDEGATIATARAFDDTIAQSYALKADWNGLLIEVLSR